MKNFAPPRTALTIIACAIVAFTFAALIGPTFLGASSASAEPVPTSTAVASTPAEPRPTSTPVVVAPTPTPTPSPTAAPQAGLSVSSPDGTLAAPAGTVVDTWLRIGNASSSPVAITIAPATVNLGNDGVTGFTPGIDPRFAGQITLSQTTALIPVGGYIQLAVKVAVPAAIIPDIYVLGFLVTPDATGTSVRIINQIGSIIAFDVPGSRDRHLTASFTSAPWIMFTNHPTLTIRASSVGKSALEFTSQDTLTGIGVESPVTTRNDPRLLPAGTHRDMTVPWNIPWGFGVNTITSTLLYPKTVSGNAQIVLTHQVIVIKPLLAIIVGAVLVLLALVCVLVRRLSKRDAPLRRHTWEEVTR